MDYEQFYRYLNTRGPDEIRKCLQNVTELAQKRGISLHLEATTNDPDKETSARLSHLQISKKIWFQHAVWNKFGSCGDGEMSVRDLALRVGELCCEGKVVEYISGVNQLINKEVIRSSGSVDTSTVFKADNIVLGSSSSVSQSPTPQTDTVPVADTQHIDNTEGHTSSTDESDLESVSEASEISAHSLLPLPRPPAKERKLKTPPAKKRKLEKPPVIWTSAMDAAVVKAVAKYKVDGWDAVLKHLQFEVTRTQLASRWNFHLQYKQQKPKAKPARAKEGPAWTVSALSELTKLVPMHTKDAHWSIYCDAWIPQSIDWQAIGKLIERPAAECRHKWKSVNQVV